MIPPWAAATDIGFEALPLDIKAGLVFWFKKLGFLWALSWSSWKINSGRALGAEPGCLKACQVNGCGSRPKAALEWDQPKYFISTDIEHLFPSTD